MKRVLYIFLSVLIYSISACQNYDEPEPGTRTKRTVIVYMAAENSLSRFFARDTLEMTKAAAYVPDDVNFVIYLDGPKYPTICTLTAQEGKKTWKEYRKDIDSADSTNMLNTIKEIANAFPAEHYGLVLWSHASGWVNRKEAKRRNTILVDNNCNSSASNIGSEMNISELRWVLENFKHLDYIFFDACFMQSIEVAYELRKVTDYIVGSPAEIPGEGAPYEMIMTALCNGDAKEIANQYYEGYKDGDGVVLSVIDCSKLEALAKKTAQYVPTVWANKAELNTSGIQYYVPFITWNSHHPEPFDMNSTMHKLLPEDMYEEWRPYLDAAVPFRKATPWWFSVLYHASLTDPDYFSGVSMFIPHSKYEPYGWDAQFQTTQWYAAAGWKQTGW